MKHFVGFLIFSGVAIRSNKEKFYKSINTLFSSFEKEVHKILRRSVRNVSREKIIRCFPLLFAKEIATSQNIFIKLEILICSPSSSLLLNRRKHNDSLISHAYFYFPSLSYNSSVFAFEVY